MKQITKPRRLNLTSRLNDLSVRGKIFAASGVFTALMCVLIFFSIFNLLWIRDAARNMYRETFVEAQKMLTLKADLENARRALLSMLAEREHAKLKMHLDSVMSATDKVDNDINFILSEDQHFSDEVVQNVGHVKSIWEEFKQTRDHEIVPAIFYGKLTHAATIATTIQERRFGELIAVIDNMIEYEKYETFLAQDSIEKRLTSSFAAYALILGSGIVVALILSYYASRLIGGRMRKVTDALEKVRNGELDLKIDVAGKDEIGLLAVNFNRMARQLYEDKINQEQTVAVLNWNADESAKRTNALAESNSNLANTQAELLEKNERLEASMRERKEMSRKITDTENMMLQSEKMASIGQLAAGVAHEINNPVGFVSCNFNTVADYTVSFMDLFKKYFAMAEAMDAGRTEEAMDCLAKLKRYQNENDIAFMIQDISQLIEESKDGMKRIQAIVQGLKEFSHGGQSEMAECDINKCLEDTLRLCAHELKYRVKVEKDFGKTPHMLGNPQKICQVLMNIIINAAHAIPEKGKITVKTYSEDGNIFVKITDTGTGMPEDVKRRIFEPFYTTKPVGKGTGLGLSLAYGIVKEHKGSIAVESKVGEGTVFTLTFPAHDGIAIGGASDALILQNGAA